LTAAPIHNFSVNHSATVVSIYINRELMEK
jgi:hypothetical protein